MAGLVRSPDTRYGASDTGRPLLDHYFYHNHSTYDPFHALLDQSNVYHEHDHLVGLVCA